ncbi:MAG: zinc-ribbon domain-containing protein, partial [Rubrobacter sp.]
MKVCPECGAEVTQGMKFCAECGTRLDVGQSTVSYAPSFGDEAGSAASGEVDGAALIELDQVEGTAG